jgi:endonuclease/exonuclease/phosphatase (EEP) superfamily protein YafD
MRLLNVSFYLLVIAMVFAALGDRFWFFDLFSHFVLQYWVIALVLFCFCVARLAPRKAFILAVLWLWATIELGSAVLDQAPTVEIVHKLNQVRIFNFNAEGNPEALNHWLPVHAAEFDIIVLLEATPDFKKLIDDLAVQFPYQALHLENSPFGIAVLSRWEIADTKKFMTETEAFPQFNLQIKNPESGDFKLYAMHIPPPFSPSFELSHKKILTELSDKLQNRKLPAIVVGDLNTTSYSSRYQRLMSDTGLNDTAGISPWAHTWPSMTLNFVSLLGIRIDHCLVSPTFTLVEQQVLEDLGSDHLPVKILLQFEK